MPWAKIDDNPNLGLGLLRSVYRADFLCDFCRARARDENRCKLVAIWAWFVAVISQRFRTCSKPLRYRSDKSRPNRHYSSLHLWFSSQARQKLHNKNRLCKQAFIIFKTLHVSPSWWFSLFSLPFFLTMYWYCKERLDVDHSWVLESSKHQSLLSLIILFFFFQQVIRKSSVFKSKASFNRRRIGLDINNWASSHTLRTYDANNFQKIAQ